MLIIMMVIIIILIVIVVLIVTIKITFNFLTDSRLALIIGKMFINEKIIVHCDLLRIRNLFCMQLIIMIQFGQCFSRDSELFNSEFFLEILLKCLLGTDGVVVFYPSSHDL